MYFVYILYSDDFRRTYSGISDDVERRLEQHNGKQSKSTKAFVPWRIIHTEEFETRMEARKKEKYFKSGVGRDYMKTLLFSQNIRPRSSAE